MQKKQKTHQKSHNKLAAWLNNQPAKSLKSIRLFVGVAGALLAYPMIILSLWFYEEITLKTLAAGTSFNLFEWLAPAGLFMAPIAALFAAFFIGRQHNIVAAKMLLVAVIAALIGVITTIAYVLMLGTGDYFTGVGEAVESFLEFGRVSVGSLSISLPVTLIVAILALVFTNSDNKSRK